MSDNRWIVWQNACEKMHSHFLTELRRLLASKAVATHAEILETMEGIYHPLMPKETIDIDAEDPPTAQQLPTTRKNRQHTHFRLLNEEKDRRIQQAINEIGVPSKDYPANIANAYDILMGNGIFKGEPK